MDNVWDLENYFYHHEDNIESKELIDFKLPNIDLNKANQKYEFHIHDSNSRILLSDSYVHLKWRILKKDGNSIGNDNVTAVCGLNPFKSKKLTINGTSIEHVSDDLHIIQHLLRLGEYTPEYLSSQATELFIFLDSNDTTDRKKFIVGNDGTITPQTPITQITDKLKVIENEDYNEGFDKRYELTKDSKYNTIWIPLRQIFDFVKNYPKVLPGHEIKIEFERNSDENMLYTDVANPNYKVEFVELSLKLAHIKLKNSGRVNFDKLVASGKNIDIYWNNYDIYRINQIDKHNRGSYNIPASTDEILKLYVIPQYTDRTDNIKSNNMIFDNLDMIECWYSINGIPKLAEHYMMDFNNKEWNRLYEAFLEVTTNKSTETAPLLDYFKFGELYPIICFDLSKHEDYISVGSLTVSFNYRLRNDTNKAYVLYIITEVRKRSTINIKKLKLNEVESLAT